MLTPTMRGSLKGSHIALIFIFSRYVQKPQMSPLSHPLTPKSKLKLYIAFNCSKLKSGKFGVGRASQPSPVKC